VSLALVGPGDGGRFLGRLRQAARRSGLLRGVTLKVVLFALACLLIVAVLAAKLGNIQFFAHRVRYHAVLTDATGLQPAADVKIAGVTVGEVDSIRVRHGLADVTFSVNRGVKLPSDTKVGMQWQNVIGNQYLYLYPGTSPVDLRPGATIPASQDVASPNIGAFLDALEPVLSAVQPKEANEVVVAFAQALSGNEAQLNQLIDSAASVSSTLGSLNGQVGQVISQLDQVFTALSQRSADVAQLIDHLDTIGQSLAQNNGLLDQTIGNFATAAKEIAELVAHTRGDLSASIGQLDQVAGTIEANDGSLAKGLSTIGQGLAPYTLISNYGQWFQVRAVYTCLAGEQVCSYYDPTSPPAGSGPLGSPPLSFPALPGLGTSTGSATSTSGTGGSGAPTSTLGPSGLQALSGLTNLPLAGALSGGGAG
jgi:phospholipid/cholesterol/gamma-HCH transport system substrate-binding protein